MLMICGLLFAGCAGNRILPEQSRDICRIFEDNEDWFRSALKTSKQWGIPIPVMMAIMYQESAFDARAKPPRTTCCLVLPGPRPSSAFGYAQALDSTWEKYRQATDNWGAERDDFADALDFIGWYCHRSHVRCQIPVTDAYGLYLAYHEGHTGYLRQTYQHKRWLKKTAGRVQHRYEQYARQLAGCEKKLRASMGCCCFFWPF